MLITARTGAGGFPGIVVPLFIDVGSLNLISANAAAHALGCFPKIAGTTSAVLGAVQFGLVALAGALVTLPHRWQRGTDGCRGSRGRGIVLEHAVSIDPSTA